MIGFRIRQRKSVADRALVEKLATLPVANISDVMSRLPAGGATLRPYHDGTYMKGVALTVKTRPGDNLMLHKAIEMAGPGDIIVCDAGGDLTNSLMGEMMYEQAMYRGVSGFVLDGAIRDCAGLRKGSLPIYAAGVTHRGPYRTGPGEINIPVSVGGMVVAPGDIILGDEDGVLCVKPDEAEAAYVAGKAILDKEIKLVPLIREGKMDRTWIDKTLAQMGCVIDEE